MSRLIKFLMLVISVASASPALAQEPTTIRQNFGLAELLVQNYAATDALLSNAQQKLTVGLPVLVTTIVNIDDLEQSSSFGRLVSEQISARISSKNIDVVEIKMQNHIYMKNNVGELMLTRHISEIASANQVQAILVGTYYVGIQDVSVNLKLVRPDTNIVIAANNYIVPLSEFTGDLLGFKRKVTERKSFLIRVTGDNCGGSECSVR